MLLRLSRASFWLAALAAAMALAWPAGHETLLTGLAVVGGIAAVGLWRSGLHAERREAGAASIPPAALLEDADLAEAAGLVERAALAAADLEAALEAVADVLKAELGARSCTVHLVTALDSAHVHFAERIVGAPPGFHAAPRAIRLDAVPLGAAIRERRIVASGAADSPIAVPIEKGGEPTAALLLDGIALAVTPAALMGVLEAARRGLEARAAALQALEKSPQVAGVHTPSVDRCAVAGAVADNRQRSHADRPSSTAAADACRPNPPMVSEPRLDASSGVPPLQTLDAGVLAGLAELDPGGSNGLIERLLQTFKSSSERLRQQLEAGRTDRKTVLHVAHTFKSSAANIGALGLSDLAAEVMTATPKDVGAAELDATSQRLLEALAATLAAVDRHLA